MEDLIASMGEAKQAADLKDDVATMKSTVFGSSGFWINDVTLPSSDTTTQAIAFRNDEPQVWITFRGNLRGESAEVFKTVEDKMQETFGMKI